MFERAILARLSIITSLLCLFYTIGAFVLYLIETYVHSIDREVLELIIGTASFGSAIAAFIAAPRFTGIRDFLRISAMHIPNRKSMLLEILIMIIVPSILGNAVVSTPMKLFGLQTATPWINIPWLSYVYLSYFYKLWCMVIAAHSALAFYFFKSIPWRRGAIASTTINLVLGMECTVPKDYAFLHIQIVLTQILSLTMLQILMVLLQIRVVVEGCRPWIERSASIS